MLLRYILTVLLTVLSHVTALRLAPLDSSDLNDAKSPSKREASFTRVLDLQDVESFYWGAPAGNKLIFANLTVYFPEQYRYVIAMERFAGKLRSVECSEDMMLEFNNDADFAYAKGVWNWVNNDVNNSFIMVTNYAGCADDMERLPFVVSNIRYDEVQNKAYLAADLKDWEEIAHSYTLNVGHMSLTPNHRMLMERGIVPRGSDFSMDLTSGYDKNLFSATVGGWTTSVDAVVRTVGNLNVDFDLDVDWLKLKSASMTITPEDVAASIQLALSEDGTLSKAYSWQKTIISIPIEGVEIAKVVKIGAFLDVDMGFTMDEWSGTANANLGARMALSNAATVKIDLVNSKNNRFSGWTPTFTPIPLILNAKVEGSAKVFAEPNVKLEASALGKGWNVGLNLQMPYIAADFAAMADSTGVCETQKTLGVDIDARIGVELSAQAATKGNEANPFWEQSLYSNEWSLFSKCLAFGPANAATGEVANPNPPASKTKKPKKPKSTKATKTATSKKPKSTKPPKTSEEPTPTKASSTKRSASKTTETDERTPTKTTPGRTTKPTRTKEPPTSSISKKSTAEDKTKVTHSSTESSMPPNTDSRTAKTAKPTAEDITSIVEEVSSTADILHSASMKKSSESVIGATSSSSLHSTITLSLSSTSFSTFSWTNASHVRIRTKDDPQSSVATAVTTNDPLSGSGKPTHLASGTELSSGTASFTTVGDEKPPASAAASTLPPRSTSDTTPAPASISTAITSTPLSSSSASAEVCDASGSGCKHCKDSLDMDAPTREYFAIETDGDGMPDPASNTTFFLLKRVPRSYQFVCGADIYPVSLAKYPTYKSRTERPSVFTVSDWYQAADSTDCLNHKITTTAANPPTTSHTNPYFAAEHVYEGNWVLNFLRYLHEQQGLSCQDMKALFFTAASTNNAGTSWAQALMESLGSHTNQDLLVFLRQNINGAKFRIFMDDNDIIGDEVFQNETASGKMERIAIVGRALDYMAQNHVGDILRSTAESVEKTLNALAKAAAADDNLKGKLGELEGDNELAGLHRSWLHSFMNARNAVATGSMKHWASEASKAYEAESPGMPRSTDANGVTQHADRTLKFLQALQTDPPTGFDATKYAPLLP